MVVLEGRSFQESWKTFEKVEQMCETVPVSRERAWRGALPPHCQGGRRRTPAKSAVRKPRRGRRRPSDDPRPWVALRLPMTSVFSLLSWENSACLNDKLFERHSDGLAKVILAGWRKWWKVGGSKRKLEKVSKRIEKNNNI